MRVYIDANDVQSTDRARQLLRFTLARAAGEINEARLSLETIHGPLGEPLLRCRACIRLRDGSQIKADEIQSKLDVAVSRALERCVRTAELRLATARRLKSA